MILHKENHIQYQILSEEKLKETISFVTHLFVEHEYLTKESGLTFDAFNVFVRLYCEASLIH